MKKSKFNIAKISYELTKKVDEFGNTIIHLPSAMADVKFLHILQTAAMSEDFDINMRNNKGESPLTIACMSKNYKAVKAILSYDAKVDYDSIRAAIYGGKEISKLVLDSIGTEDNEIMVESAGGSMLSPLFIACKLKDYYAAIALLKLGAKIDYNILKEAIIGDDTLTSIILSSIKKGDPLLEQVNVNDNIKPPLFIACQSKNYNAIKALLQLGAKVDYDTLNESIYSGKTISRLVIHSIKEGDPVLEIVNKDGLGALTHAFRAENYVALQILLEKGVGTDLEKQLALEYSLNYILPKCVKLLLNNGAKIKEGYLNLTIKARNEELTSILLDKIEEGNDIINECELYGFTPLMNSAIQNLPGIALDLIALGADIDKQNDAGETALTLASKRGFGRLSVMLVEKGADPTITDNENDFALAYWLKEDPKVAKSIYIKWKNLNNGNITLPLDMNINHLNSFISKDVNSKVDMTKQDKTGRNIFHYAVIGNNYRLLETYCSEYPHLIDQPDNKGNSPLHQAFMLGNYNVAKLLLKHSKDVLSVNEINNKNLAILACEARVRSDIKLKLLDLIFFAGIEEYDLLGNNPIKRALLLDDHLLLNTLLKKTPKFTLRERTLREKESIVHLESDLPETISDKDVNETWKLIHFLINYKDVFDAEPYYSTLKVLKQYYDINEVHNDKTPLMIAVENRNLEQVALLLHLDALPHKCNRFGESALTTAIKIGDLSTLLLLVESSSFDMNKKYKDGNNLLMLSLQENPNNRLLRPCDDSNFKPFPDKLSLAAAVYNRSTDKFEKNPLIEAEMSFFRSNNRKIQPVCYINSYSTKKGNSVSIIGENLIFDICLDEIKSSYSTLVLNETNIYGNTALHLAVINNNLYVVKKLLECNASFSIKNSDGKTALDLATEMGYTEAKELISNADCPKDPDTILSM